MDKKILSNYLYNVIYQIVKICIPLVLVPYTMARIGASTLGINDYAANIAGYFILFGVLGIDIYGTREIAKVRDNKDELSKTFFELFTVSFTDMMIMFVFYLIYVVFNVKNNNLIYYLQLLTILTSAFEINWFFYGIENFKVVSIRNMVIKLSSVVLIFIFIKSPADLWKYVVINSGTDLLAQGIAYFNLRKYIKIVPLDIIGAYRKHFKNTLAVFLPSIALSFNIFMMMNQTMLGYMIEDKADVSLYKTAQGFVKMFLFFITSIGAVMSPRISHIFHQNNNSEEVNGYINSTFKIALILAIPMMCGIYALSPYFFPWYMETEPGIIKMVQYTVPMVVFISISNVFGQQYLIPIGRNKEFTISVVLGAICNFVANLFLIPLYHGVGAIIGTCIAECVEALTQWLFIRKEIHIKAIGTFIKCAISSVLMTIVVIFVGRVTGIRILGNVVQVMLGGLIYIISLIVLKEELVIDTINKLLKRN